MSFLFFDTETTGLPDFRSPVGAEFQPRVIQIAAILTDDFGKTMTQFCSLVKLDSGVKVEEKAFQTHGISWEMADKFGLSAVSCLRLMERLISMADAVVAHNIKFDDWMMARESVCCGGAATSPINKPMVCTQELSSPILNLPPTEKMVAAGFNKPKPPKLEEAYRHFFGRDIVGAHDAMADCLACKEVFFAINAPMATSI